MSEYCCRIERAQNGYTVEINDPAIVKANNAPRKSDSPSAWRSPRKEYVFETIESVLEFLKKNLDKALPLDEYSSAFTKAMEMPDD